MIPLSENDIELIENYCSGQLTPTDQAQFEQRLKADPAFHRNALNWQYITDAFQANAEDISRQAEIRSFLVKRRRLNRLFYWAKWAIAVLTAFFLIRYFWPNKEQQIERQLIAELQRPFTSRQSQLGTSDNAIPALQLFDSRKYPEAAPALQRQFEASGNKDSVLLFYKGVALLQNNETEEAVALLRISVNSQQIIQDDARWFLALALLREKKYDEARKELEKLSASGTKTNEATQFLSLLPQ